MIDNNKTLFLSYKELIAKDLNPGDLIEIDRGSYKHWVIFAYKCDSGAHWCYHVKTATGDFEKGRAVMSSSVGSVSQVIASIRKQKLKDIIEDNKPAKLSRARINNKTDEARKKKCVPRPIQQVIDSLEEMKDEKVQYCLKNLNCEHYVTKWKYGAGWSRQVDDFIDAAVVTAGVVSVAVIAGVIVSGIVGLFSSDAKHENRDGDSDSD